MGRLLKGAFQWLARRKANSFDVVAFGLGLLQFQRGLYVGGTVIIIVGSLISVFAETLAGVEG